VQQELFAQEADRNAISDQVAIQYAEKNRLARAYAQTLLDSMGDPGPQVVATYHNAHPALFAERRQYQLQQVANQQTKRAQQTGNNTGTRLSDQHPLTILVADDNEVNQKVAQKLLGWLGYEVELVSNGLEAVNRLAERPFDVIFMDIQMPEMDGVSAAQKILERYGDGKRPFIIAMTAHALKGDREKLLDGGMDAYISKPVRLDSLTEVLQKIIQKCIILCKIIHTRNALSPVFYYGNKLGFFYPPCIRSKFKGKNELYAFT